MVYNEGVFLGIKLNGILYISALILFILVLWEIKIKSFGLILIIIGGFFNFYQRLRYGYVVDYWKVPFFNIYNNFMDWLIFIGIILFIIELWKKK